MLTRLVASFLLFAIATSSPAGAEDECILSEKGLEWRLPKKAAGPYLGKVTTKRSKHERTEKVRLKAGGALELVQGGCAHMGITYEFSGLADTTPLSDRKHYLERAAELLKTLPGRNGEPLDSQFAEGIAAAIKDIPRANVADKDGVMALFGECSEAACASEYACGDAHCSVSVTGKIKGKITLTAVYDFAL